MLSIFLNIFFGFLFIYFALSVCYLFILAIAGKYFYKREKYEVITPEKKIAVFVPAYKEDGIIVSTAKSMLALEYPRDLYDVYILADSFQKETIEALKQLPVEVIEVKFEKSTKTKALNEGFRWISKNYDVALICDADNVLAKNFLKKVNDAFTRNVKGIQGRRVAKNMDTSYAILDSCSEAINNHIFRKGTNAVGLSSAVIGSGMAFDYSCAKEVLSEINAVGGFDRPLQLKIVERGIKIEYLENALIFDEKVDSLHAFKQQRKRWLSSQYIYMKQYFFPGFKQLLKGNISYFNLAIANNLVLPRAYLLLLLPVLILISYFIKNEWFPFFLATAVVYLLTLAIALPSVMVNKKLFYAILKMPEAIGAMVLTAFQMKNANKTFIHTVHTKTEVSNTLYNQSSE
jgi:cellulose synthase/poly-beta-1,6-N-acetylglucosamine synthase-like glycosyltransferase